MKEVTNPLERSESILKQIILENLSHLVDRFLDPKNAAKGRWLNIEPMKMYRYIQTEALEANQAYRNNEGIKREQEELADIMLFCLFRYQQIKKENNENT
jgi:NTP pyrophosphatase (non-canonical NTP hydrolase)